MDWTLIRSFLAVADHGSLSAAARALGLTQPTLGRHITELSVQLQTPLFTRSARGLEPSDAALALLPAARQMREAAARLELAAAGASDRLQGTVRLTASRVISHHVLPWVLARLRVAEPGIEIELVPSDTPENLLFREADIALRMFRPDQDGTFARHLIDLPMGLYAAKTYLDRRGRPQAPPDLAAHDLIGMDRSDLVQRMLDFLKVPLKRADFPVRCDDQLVYLNLIRAGLGIGGALRLIGDADPLLEPAAPFLALPALPVWLTAPQALRHTPRIRRVLDHLAAEFLSLLDPGHLDPGPVKG
ncbi:LysR family transcriptional regulator [Rhodobacter sp. KR11]|jgi:DNA-binding transcriptional LysR family regulator|uniref:LysR family transcriptional regulator n=1 Tax=Rhodobacter sp. KR11 TaxID=2974588 RepID=UPI002222C589|nr:LysR family transcriptional regulator [Rhodobacter sp. KR11]MCW1919254.1 LysR family transcriptional regulator [Rhodobacter sp. KR11]